MNAPARIRIVIVDRSRLFIDAATVALSTLNRIEVVASAEERAEGIFLTKVHQPRLLVVGADSVGTSLKLLSGMVAQASPATRLVLAGEAGSPEITEGLAIGLLWGVVDHAMGVREFAHVLDAAASARRRITARPADVTVTPRRPRAAGPLSSRELEVLELLGEGATNGAIAAELFISTGTVKRHVANIYAKLGVGSRVDALRAGVSLGLVQLPPSGAP